ncbi:MAG: serine/threonine-protein kinase [Planctomycetota bacterium]
MSVSADAALFALSLLEEGHFGAEELSKLLHRAAGAEGRDQLVALQDRAMERRPALSGAIARLAGESSFVPVDCPGCRASFRVPPQDLDPGWRCPLCDEPLMTAGSVLLLAPRSGPHGRAAEGREGYFAGPPRERYAHFDLVELIGRGGAGKVYRARNRRSDETVALKLLDFQPLEPAREALRKLRREARAASSVAHPNVVPVLDLGVAEGVPYIEMELVEGEPLNRRVRREGMLEPRDGVRICLQAARGLAAVHEARIVHGDVKPDNILIDTEGRARLTDFGLATFLEETTTISSGGKVVGSPHFMAPEQWRGEPLEPPADLYALGLVLYFALTGELPYEGDQRYALMYKHLHEPLLRPDATRYPIPELLAQVIRRAGRKSPDERFQTAEQFAEPLELFLNDRQPPEGGR